MKQLSLRDFNSPFLEVQEKNVEIVLISHIIFTIEEETCADSQDVLNLKRVCDQLV